MLTFQIDKEYETCNLSYFNLMIKNKIYLFTRESNGEIINSKCHNVSILNNNQITNYIMNIEIYFGLKPIIK